MFLIVNQATELQRNWSPDQHLMGGRVLPPGIHAGRVDIAARRRDYEGEGWKRFDEDAPAYTPEQVRDYRASFIPPM